MGKHILLISIVDRFRNFKTKILTLPKSSNAFAQVANDRLKIFNDQLKKLPFDRGGSLSICDITLFSILDFGLKK